MISRAALLNALWWLGVAALVALVAFIAFEGMNAPSADDIASTSASSTPAFDQTIGDGALTIAFPSKDFGLATNAAQVLARAYIPPCDPAFDYCLYYIGNAYAGTNFESAGLRVKKRAVLTNQKSCLTTPPAGYTSLKTAASTSTAAYAASVFSPLGDAGAGHYANGTLYRLYDTAPATCYELETRIGETQFANYPPGAIQKFTDADRAALSAELDRMLEKISLGGTQHLFPTP
ncbi:MAG: hypothetical protein KGI73_03265 [Patescibacteria group bacterium]|nr:hypothetical protein [Patescibacteria group bacterium]